MKTFRHAIALLLAISLIAVSIGSGSSVRADGKLPIGKNVIDLTPTEKAAFINAIKTLKNTTLPEHPISVYPSLITLVRVKYETLSGLGFLLNFYK